MPENEAEVPLKIQLEEAERKGREKGRKEGMDDVLAALKAARARQLSEYTYNHRFEEDCSNYFGARLDAALLNAAKENQADVVFSLVKAGADTKACNKSDHSALYVAVKGGHTEVVQALLKAGANPNYLCEEEYETPLACAVRQGQVQIVKALLAGGADVHQGDGPQYSHWLIDYEAAGDQVELTRAFIQAGAYLGAYEHDDNDWTPLMHATMNGKTESAALLIEAGSDVNAKNDDFETMLMMAAQGDKEGALDTIRFVLKAGAEMNFKNCHGRTALTCALEAGCTEAVCLLLSAGADVHNGIEPGKGEWLIDYEAEGDQVELTRAFVNAGAYLGSYEGEYGCTPLKLAASHSKTASAALLIEAGCDVNAQDTINETALMVAAQGDTEGALDTIRFLLKAGAEVNHKDNYRHTALIFAAKNGSPEAVRLLLSAGADVFSQAPMIPSQGRPALVAGNAFDLATNDAVKEIIKNEMHRRIAAALSVLPTLPTDVRQKIVQLYLCDSGLDELDTDAAM